MKGDDDEDDHTTNIGSTRYPCMPSLVALQQMRNRLHMAHLGKRLMKWTALATGKEMRRVARDINEMYLGFSGDVSEAYILLARCRYFYPNLNNMVLQNPSPVARLTVDITTKSVAGCRFLVLSTIDSEEDPYPHLGIDKGGQTIEEAKKAWMLLLIRLVNITNLRTGFTSLDIANKSATKKMNVLGKMVIPRTNLSIKYILDELEELAREDFFRLKKVINLKEKNRKKKHDHEEIIPTCPVCLKMLAKLKGEVERCKFCGKALPQEGEEQVEVVDEISEAQKLEDKVKLEELIAHLEEISEMKKDVEERKQLYTPSMEEFLLTADDIKAKLEERINKEEEKIIVSPEENLEKVCPQCRKKIVVEEPEPEETSETEILKPEAGEMPDVESKAIIKQEEKAEVVPLTHLYEHPPPPEQPELGIFETEIKEIVKIIRTKNEDGTITEEKKVLKIKKEIREPKRPEPVPSGKVENQPSQASAKSNLKSPKQQSTEGPAGSEKNPYSKPKTVGVVTIGMSSNGPGNILHSPDGPSTANNTITAIANKYSSDSFIGDLGLFFNEHDTTISRILEKLNNTQAESNHDIEELLHLFEPLSMLHKVSASTETNDNNSEIYEVCELKDESTQYEQRHCNKFYHVSLSESCLIK